MPGNAVRTKRWRTKQARPSLAPWEHILVGEDRQHIDSELFQKVPHDMEKTKQNAGTERGYSVRWGTMQTKWCWKATLNREYPIWVNIHGLSEWTAVDLMNQTESKKCLKTEDRHMQSPELVYTASAAGGTEHVGSNHKEWRWWKRVQKYRFYSKCNWKPTGRAVGKAVNMIQDFCFLFYDSGSCMDEKCWFVFNNSSYYVENGR